ncbi:hypothetical protein J2Y89_003094 [Curtobacterium herbarum]|uniref:M23 family metallopeptidase n=1 Tax=Curtobacterium herbarum TaxID=150122 RepID=UPI0020A1F74A|nr:M23 family metallopeptidase [Curtobacterium herbarum]MCP1504350.1 hypothetical protein [Curtobacterium herbarum]
MSSSIPVQYGSRRARRTAEALPGTRRSHAGRSDAHRPHAGRPDASRPQAHRSGARRSSLRPPRRSAGSAAHRPTSRPHRRFRPGVALTVSLVRASIVAAAHDVRQHCWARRGLALTSIALAACLVVTDTAPRSAIAAPVEALAPGPPNQDFRVHGTAPDTTARADFTVVGRTTDGVLLARTPGSTVAAARPVAGTIPSAGNFGGRNVAGCAACSTSHQGTDFAAASGTPVVAVMSGTVESAGVFGGYGNQVLLRHPDGTETRYGHLSVIGVRPGQTVGVGERIGAVGSTGVSTGPHLHFEVILGGRPVDPEPWLAARGLLH